MEADHGAENGQKKDWLNGYVGAVVESERDDSDRLKAGSFNAGAYRFRAVDQVSFTIKDGFADVNLPGKGWQRFPNAVTPIFSVPAGNHFEIRCAGPVSFGCAYAQNLTF